MRKASCYIGTAGWGIPKEHRTHLQNGSGQLALYAQLFNSVEVNSTFYKLPRVRTVEQWTASVPPDFRFALKMPKRITHEAKLHDTGPALAEFLVIVEALGQHAGPILVQLPPKQAFTEQAEDFLQGLAERDVLSVVVEPRHSSWFTPMVDAFLKRCRIGRVAADPARAAGDGIPGGDTRLVYFRLHGSPRIYWSAYAPDEMLEWAGVVARARRTAQQVWVVFDNTGAGAATENALDLNELLAL